MDTMVAPQPIAAIEDVLDSLATIGDKLPREAMRWALDNWEIAAPRFLAGLEACANGEDRSDRTTAMLFFALYLLAEKRETRAFPALCRLMRNSERLDTVLGDGIGESLAGIIISTFDGNSAALQSVIEAADGDQYVRSSALDALSYLVHTGAAHTLALRAYLQHLFETMHPRSPGYIWSSWAIVVARMGYADMTPFVEQAFDLGFIEPFMIGMDTFQRELRQAMDDPTRMVGFQRDGIEPFSDAIGDLSTWYHFSDKRQEDERRQAERSRFEERTPWLDPHRNPLRHVGRNDPCPCGSGKKYKKCCLPA